MTIKKMISIHGKILQHKVRNRHMPIMNRAAMESKASMMIKTMHRLTIHGKT